MALLEVEVGGIIKKLKLRLVALLEVEVEVGGIIKS